MTAITPTPVLTDTASRPAAARAVDATKVYGDGDFAVRALDGVTLDIPAARFTAIMGASGSGKSTLMHCLAGLDTLTAGEVWIGDTELGSLNDRQLTRLRREHIGFVFQAFNLVPTLTAYENLTLPFLLDGRAPDRDWIDELVRTVGLEARLQHRPSELSGGQQQRVAIARALANSPRLLIADEPTGQLDADTGASIMELIRSVVRSEGMTAIISTHDASVEALTDQTLRLADGRLVSSAT